MRRYQVLLTVLLSLFIFWAVYSCERRFRAADRNLQSSKSTLNLFGRAEETEEQDLATCCTLMGHVPPLCYYVQRLLQFVMCFARKFIPVSAGPGLVPVAYKGPSAKKLNSVAQYHDTDRAILLDSMAKCRPGWHLYNKHCHLQV